MFDFAANAEVIWLAAAIMFALMEAVTTGLITIWFAGGALAALIAAMFGAPLIVQLAVFVVVSGILVAITRPLARKYVNRKAIGTNVDAIVGQEGIVISEIKAQSPGQVKADGKVWSAVSESGDITENTVVIIKEVKGVTVTVITKNE